jgi:hypothetical protein
MNKKGCFQVFGFFVVMLTLCFWYIVNHQPISETNCNGIKISLNLNKIKADKYLKCPNGEIGFINTANSKTPIIFKKDTNSNLLWAYKLESDSCSGIPFKKMKSMKLVENDGDLRITFFNYSYSEPGTIYLDDQYNFKSFYLSPL